MSSNLPLVSPIPNFMHDFGMYNTLNKLIVNQIGFIMSTAVNQVFYSKNRYVTPEAREARIQSREDVFIGDGVMGIRDRK